MTMTMQCNQCNGQCNAIANAISLGLSDIGNVKQSKEGRPQAQASAQGRLSLPSLALSAL